MSSRLFLRFDGNVPLNDTAIRDDFKLRALLPTLDHLRAHGIPCLLATHLGRPAGPDETLSTKHLVPWFAQHGHPVAFCNELSNASVTQARKISPLVLLENVRFYPGECAHDMAFARTLRSLASHYMNDAFGVIHRNDTSVTLLPTLFDPSSRQWGPLVVRERAMLDQLRTRPPQPFVMLCSGSKMHDKLPLIARYIHEHTVTDLPHTFLIGGALAHPFFEAQGYSVGRSLRDPAMIPIAQHILSIAREKNITLMVPTDVRYTLPGCTTVYQDTLANLPDTACIIDAGVVTTELFMHYLNTAKSIFMNGTLGMYETTPDATATHAILQAIAASRAFSIIGGGDAVAAVRHFNLEKHVSFCSSGGGASLAYLATERLLQLPALAALDYSIQN